MNAYDRSEIIGFMESCGFAVEQVTDAVTRAFADADFTAPHIFPVSPSAGPRRDA